MSSFEAMMFARTVHGPQLCPYSGIPHFQHLAEVAGIVATLDLPALAVKVAWLHDCMEDQSILQTEIEERFGRDVMLGVTELSNLTVGTAEVCRRLVAAPGWVQSIKCAEILSNAAVVRRAGPPHAPMFASAATAMIQACARAHAGIRNLAMGSLL
jgi:GTP diphosphokinase / guanosine-3',5'-bis(diphosphate) 3'-diphosphatase